MECEPDCNSISGHCNESKILKNKTKITFGIFCFIKIQMQSAQLGSKTVYEKLPSAFGIYLLSVKWNFSYCEMQLKQIFCILTTSPWYWDPNIVEELEHSIICSKVIDIKWWKLQAIFWAGYHNFMVIIAVTLMLVSLWGQLLQILR